VNVRVHIVTEGQTETNFVNRLLVPHFSRLGITLVPCTVVTKNDIKAGRQHKGGISNYLKVKNDILRCLAFAKVSEVYVSTMFDLYHLPTDFPCYAGAEKINDPYSRVEFLESSLKEDLCKNSPVFLPYLSLHEFEALLFSDIGIVEEHFFDANIMPLRKTVSQYPNPELINNSEQTAPSKRIFQCVTEYTKPVDGVEIAQKIGLTNLRKKCRHFDDWIGKLENLHTSRHQTI
jgi:hypothetical protein